MLDLKYRHIGNKRAYVCLFGCCKQLNGTSRMTIRHLIFIFSLMFCSNSLGQNKANFQPNFKISKKTTHKIKKEQKYTFGYLEVLENRQNPNSRTIEIPVYIFKSRSEKPKKDPIILYSWWSWFYNYADSTIYELLQIS